MVLIELVSKGGGSGAKGGGGEGGGGGGEGAGSYCTSLLHFRFKFRNLIRNPSVGVIKLFVLVRAWLGLR